MSVYVQVRNKGGDRKSYLCIVGDQDYHVGDHCVFESNKKQRLGIVERILDNPPHCISNQKKLPGKIRRKGTPKDLECFKRNQDREKDAFRICLEKIEQHKLKMRLVNIEFLLDGSKATFYFTADGRIDFRQLVKDLASELHSRIEMKQIGVRDEAKIIGGFGSCGRELCCHSFLENFEPVSIRMAKVQNLSLDPSKISGVCGRLMCCLEYEFRFYDERKKKLPKHGESVLVDKEKGKVVALDYIQNLVFVEFPDGRTVKVLANEVKRIKKPEVVKR